MESSSKSSTLLVDVRGLSCPEPVLRVKEVIAGMESDRFEVITDSGASRDNVLRLASRLGWKGTVQEGTSTDILIEFIKEG